MVPNDPPFDLTTGALLPGQRDAYLRGELAAPAALAVEEYLADHPVQTAVVLARWHKLVATESMAGRALPEPPVWVQQQLLRQPSVSKIGPLRRPVFQVAMGVMLLLGVASGVQWVRQKPLVPKPVVVAARQVAQSVSEATESIASSFDSEDTRWKKAESRRLLEAATARQQELDQLKQAKERAARAAWSAGLRAQQPTAIEPIAATEPRSVSLALTESAASGNPDESADEDANRGSAETILVRGRIVDEEGHPLAGATVLVQGTTQGTSTDANGNYTLEAPVGAVLHFGYAGYVDQLLKTGAGAGDVMLEPEPVPAPTPAKPARRKARGLGFR